MKILFESEYTKSHMEFPMEEFLMVTDVEVIEKVEIEVSCQCINYRFEVFNCEGK